uniref:hypothetical protein n=1 Tax=Aliarcobacter sp. TaxID=2321116 RepID=UPI004047D0C5
MEYGLIPKLNQYTDNKALEIQKIQPSKEITQISNKDELKQIQQEAILKAKETSNIQATESQNFSLDKYEVVLTNMNFGFNDNSKDFYVKAIRGNTENQYPTEDMMRLKSYLMSLDTNAS